MYTSTPGRNSVRGPASGTHIDHRCECSPTCFAPLSASSSVSEGQSADVPPFVIQRTGAGERLDIREQGVQPEEHETRILRTISRPRPRSRSRRPATATASSGAHETAAAFRGSDQAPRPTNTAPCFLRLKTAAEAVFCRGRCLCNLIRGGWKFAIRNSKSEIKSTHLTQSRMS
jgi:hypothetical protein